MEWNKIEMLESTALFSDTFSLVLYVQESLKATAEITNLIFPYLLNKSNSFLN